MRILVVGASGATGRLAVQRLLERGDDVTALVRRTGSDRAMPEGLDAWAARSVSGASRSAVPPSHPRLRLVVGDVREPAALCSAALDQDAVLSAFGARTLRASGVQELFMRNLLIAMRGAGVRRLSYLSAWGAGNSASTVPWYLRIFESTLLRAAFRDKDRAESHLLASDVDYISVRPGRLTNDPARGSVLAGLDPAALSWYIGRADLAEFLVAQLTDSTWVRQCPLVGYRR